MTEKLLSLNKNLIFALEGGYTLDTIRRCSETTIRTLLGEDIPWKGVMIQNYLEFNLDNDFNLDFLINNYEKIFKVVPYVAEHLNEIIDEHKQLWKCLENKKFIVKEKYKKKEIEKDEKLEENKDNKTNKDKAFSEYILRKDILPIENEKSNIKELLIPFLFLDKDDFYKKNEEFIAFKIGEELINDKNDKCLYYKKKILAYRTCLTELKFNIEGVKFTKLRANATKIAQLLNWNRDEMKYDMNFNIISEILMLFFQNLKMKNKEVLKLLDAFIKKIKEKLNDSIDLYNCDLIVVPRIIKTEENEKAKQDPKKKFKLFNKKDKIEFDFYINGVKNKNIYIYNKDNQNTNKRNFIKGLEGLRKFINENVMN